MTSLEIYKVVDVDAFLDSYESEGYPPLETIYSVVMNVDLNWKELIWNVGKVTSKDWKVLVLSNAHDLNTFIRQMGEEFERTRRLDALRILKRLDKIYTHIIAEGRHCVMLLISDEEIKFES